MARDTWAADKDKGMGFDVRTPGKDEGRSVRRGASSAQPGMQG